MMMDADPMLCFSPLLLSPVPEKSNEIITLGFSFEDECQWISLIDNKSTPYQNSIEQSPSDNNDNCSCTSEESSDDESQASNSSITNQQNNSSRPSYSMKAKCQNSDAYVIGTIHFHNTKLIRIVELSTESQL